MVALRINQVLDDVIAAGYTDLGELVDTACVDFSSHIADNMEVFFIARSLVEDLISSLIHEWPRGDILELISSQLFDGSEDDFDIWVKAQMGLLVGTERIKGFTVAKKLLKHVVNSLQLQEMLQVQLYERSVHAHELAMDNAGDTWYDNR